MARTHGIDMDSWNWQHPWYTHIIGKNSWNRHGLMVLTKTHGIELDSWYRISTPESHMYDRAECCPYAGLLLTGHCILARTHGMDMDSWNWQHPWYTYVIGKNSWNRHGLMVLSLYLDERRGVQGNTSTRSREFPRAHPKGTPETKCWYFLYSPTRVKVQTLSNL